MHIKLPQLNKILSAEENENLFSLLRRSGVPIASSCSGDGVCGKCVVQVMHGQLEAIGPLEQELKTKYSLADNERISCQCLVKSDLTITTTYW
ncbi:MAG: (2Fe-2S)-binding protein [Bdellovibrionaceae bacterium]|nr:(2Fe-2S)-binding protein [Pseudobdellovibrionaceae bacterium]